MIAAAMAPVMDNINAGPSLGGNDIIDVDLALGYEFPEDVTTYDERDLALYALGVGAANDPTDGKDLQLVYERHNKGFRALPTYGVIPAMNAMIDRAIRGEKAPGLNYGPERLLHGEQYMELYYPLPAKATGISHFEDGAAVGWDMQAVENVLCGIHDCKSPEAVVASAMKLKDKNKQGKPITPWQPNPCCALEHAELYGR